MRSKSHYKSVVTENAEKILSDRYYIKDDQGNPLENFSALCKRVAGAIADVEPTEELRNKYKSRFYNIFHNLDFVPNTPTIVNAGKKSGLSACYVVPIENSYEHLLKTIQDVALIFKSGGGVGYNFSWVGLPAYYKNPPKFNVILNINHPDVDEFMKTEFHNFTKVLSSTPLVKEDFSDNYVDYNHCLHIADNLKEIFNHSALIKPELEISSIDFSQVRAKNALVNSTKGIATGPVSFIKAWDAVIDCLKNEITPISAIKMFDTCTGAVSQGGVRRGACMGILNANHKMIYDFIACKDDQNEINNFNLSVGVIDGTLFDTKYFNLSDYITDITYTNRYNSEDMLKFISKHAWKTGEPGIIFLNKINTYNPCDKYIVSTNPCKHTAPLCRNAY